MRIGLKTCGYHIPYFRLPVKETVNLWGNGNANFIKKQIGVDKRAVVASDEDVITMAVDAAEKSLEMFAGDVDEIDGILLGSCTTPDLFRSNANQVMACFKADHNYFGSDIRASENSGMVAIEQAYGLVKSSIVHDCMVVSSDVMSKHIFPSELRESYMGAGAASLIVGSGKDMIADIISFGNSNDYFPEQGRPEDSIFIRTFSTLNHSVIKEGMIKRTCEAINRSVMNAELNISDIDHFFFP